MQSAPSPPPPPPPPSASASASPSCPNTQGEQESTAGAGSTPVFPFEIRSDAARGRHAIALRQLHPGQVVLVEKAYACIPRSHQRLRLCQCCCRPLVQLGRPFDVVSLAQDYRFCSLLCSRNFSSITALETPLLSFVPQVALLSDADPDLLRIVIRLIATKFASSQMPVPSSSSSSSSSLSSPLSSVAQDNSNNNNNNNNNSNPILDTTPCIRSRYEDALALMTNIDKFSPRWIHSMTDAFSRLVPHFPGSLPHNESDQKDLVNEMLQLACRVNTNAYGSGDLEGRNAAAATFGLFPTTGLFNHSCLPNCFFFIEGTHMTVRTIAPVNAGDELNVSYIDIFQATEKRQEELLSTRYFNCNCKRCAEHLYDERLCGLANGVELSNNSSHKRRPTGKKSTTKVLHVKDAQRWDADFHTALTLLNEGKSTAAKSILELVTSQAEGLLHLEHVLFFNSYSRLLNIAIIERNYEASARYSRRVLQCLQSPAVPQFYPETANFNESLGDSLNHILQLPTANALPATTRKQHETEMFDAYRRAFEIRRICYGESHHLTQALAPKL